jgi:hypothetical protein
MTRKNNFSSFDQVFMPGGVGNTPADKKTRML